MEILSEYCGQPSICKCFFGFLICSSLNISKIPTFTPSLMLKTVHIDLSNNEFSTQPEILKPEWPLLNGIDLRENYKLPCNKVKTFVINYPSISVYHDCDKDKFLVAVNNNSVTLETTVSIMTSREVINDSMLTTEGHQKNQTQNINVKWRTELIVLLSESLILTVGVLIYALHRSAVILRRRIVSNIDTENEIETFGPHELQPLHRATTEGNLPDIILTETTINHNSDSIHLTL